MLLRSVAHPFEEDEINVPLTLSVFRDNKIVGYIVLFSPNYYHHYELNVACSDCYKAGRLDGQRNFSTRGPSE